MYLCIIYFLLLLGKYMAGMEVCLVENLHLKAMFWH